jgi:hypothetical protein
VRLEELRERRETLKTQIGWTAQNLEQGRNVDDASWLQRLHRDEEIVLKEIAIHEAEQANRNAGLPDARYEVRVADRIAMAENPDVDASAHTVVQCPECGQNTGLPMHAVGDLDHSAWLTCDAGHRWTDPKITYMTVRAWLKIAEPLDV